MRPRPTSAPEAAFPQRALRHLASRRDRKRVDRLDVARECKVGQQRFHEPPHVDRVEIAIGPDGGMFPCGRYGRKRAAPNVFELGARRAFEELMRPDDCRDCWCALTAAGCYMHGADVRMLKRW